MSPDAWSGPPQPARDLAMHEQVVDCVNRQLAAYNAHDAHAFVRSYSDDVRVYNFPMELICAGRASLLAMYAGIFERAPRIRAELTNRIVVGNRVVDHELVTGRAGKPDARAAAIYEVSGGLIQQVWLLKEG